MCTLCLYLQFAQNWDLPSLYSYENDSLDSLETGEMPVLVDNLPVIIETDIGTRHLENDSEDKHDDLEKHEEIMFSLWCVSIVHRLIPLSVVWPSRQRESERASLSLRGEYLDYELNTVLACR